MIPPLGTAYRRLSVPDAAASFTRHAESFALMLYQNKVTGRAEVLWNSRDGVTPFLINDHEAPAELVAAFAERRKSEDFDPRTEVDPGLMAHANIHDDSFMPNFIPPVGMRFFVSWSDASEAYKAETEERWKERLMQLPPEVRAEHEKGPPFGYRDTDPCIQIATAEDHRRFAQLAAGDPVVPAKPPGGGLDLGPKPRLVGANGKPLQ